MSSRKRANMRHFRIFRLGRSTFGGESARPGCYYPPHLAPRDWTTRPTSEEPNEASPHAGRAGALCALPARRRAGNHAQGPSLLAARRDAAVDAARALVRQDREGLEQPDEVPDLPGDAARRN